MPSVQGSYSFAPPGLCDSPVPSHSLRCGLHACAAFAAKAGRVAARVGGSSPTLIVKDRHYPMDNEFVFSLSNWKHGINENSMQAPPEFGSGRGNVRRKASQ